MKHVFKVGLAVVLTLAVVAFGQAQTEDQTVIQLGDTAITQSEFDERFAIAARSLAAQQGLPYNEETAALFDGFRADYLDQLATEAVLLNEAETMGITVTDEDVAAQVAQLQQDLGLESEEAFNQFITNAGFADEAQLREFLRDQQTIRRVVDEMRTGVEITDEEVQTFYEANQEQFQGPLDEVRDQVRAQLEREELNQRIAELREASELEVFPENLSPAVEAPAEGAVSQAPAEPATLETAFYSLSPVGDSGAEGRAQVMESEAEEGTRLTVTVTGLADGSLYPSHLHEGDCGSDGPVAYPLESVPGGPDSPVSFVDASFDTLMNSDLYIDVHHPEDPTVIVACGEVGLGATQNQ